MFPQMESLGEEALHGHAGLLYIQAGEVYQRVVESGQINFAGVDAQSANLCCQKLADFLNQGWSQPSPDAQRSHSSRLNHAARLRAALAP
jgi:hypothetical protein